MSGNPIVPVNPAIDPTLPMVDYGDLLKGPDGLLIIHPTEYPTTHPNTLAAITTARIAQNQDVNANERVTINPNLGDTRYNYFLDALSSLAVYDDKGQVVAMAIGTIDKKVSIVVSENTEVSGKLITHIEKLVGMLKDISDASGDKRTALQLEFYKATYLHSFNQLYKRFHRRRWLQEFDVEFAKKDPKADKNVLKCQVVLSALLTSFTAIKAIRTEDHNENTANNNKKLNFNAATVVKDEEWSKLIFMMSSAIPYVQHLIDNPKLCQTWADQLQGTVSMKKMIGTVQHDFPVPLLRAIQKLSTHHRHILLLFEFATSVTGKAFLASPPPILPRPIPSAPALEVVIPALDTMDIALRLMLPNATDLSTEIKLVETGIVTQFHNKCGGSFQPVVHCECALIAYLDGHSDPNAMPVRYIGVSKLSCGACHSWIQSFNGTHEPQYQTRGSHGRWYPGWGMPAGPANTSPKAKKLDLALQHWMVGIVGRAYRRFVDAGSNTVPVALSDSTEAKGRFPTMTWTQAEVDEAERLSKEKRSERAAVVVIVPNTKPAKK